MSDFDRAIEITLKFEGGLSDHVNDKGGLTKYGISANSYPGIDIRTLTLEQAKEIYKRDYWLPLHCDEVMWPVNLCLFDWGVNSGLTRVKRIFQSVLKVGVDGRIGPKTIVAANMANAIDLSKRLLDHRTENFINFAKNSTTQMDFLKGWIRRVNELYFIVGQASEQMDNSKNKRL